MTRILKHQVVLNSPMPSSLRYSGFLEAIAEETGGQYHFVELVGSCTICLQLAVQMELKLGNNLAPSNRHSTALVSGAVVVATPLNSSFNHDLAAKEVSHSESGRGPWTL